MRRSPFYSVFVNPTTGAPEPTAMLSINVKISGNVCVTSLVVVFRQMLMPKHLFGVLNSLPK